MNTIDSSIKKIADIKATLKALCDLSGIKTTDKRLGDLANAYSRYSLVMSQSLEGIATDFSHSFREAYLGLMYQSMQEIKDERNKIRRSNYNSAAVRNEKIVTAAASEVLRRLHGSSKGKSLGVFPDIKVAKRKDDPPTKIFNGLRTLYIGHGWIKNIEAEGISSPSCPLGDAFVVRATDRNVARLAEDGITAYNATAYIRQRRDVVDGWVFKFTGYEIEMCLFHEDFRRGESLLRKRMRKEIMSQFEED